MNAWTLMDYTNLLRTIDDFWPQLTRHHTEDRQTLIGLPRPYVVPGVGAMFQEMYYWDSFFTSLGLIESRHESLVLDMTENMAWMLQRFGMIPNGSRYYFLSRSQPPFFTQMVQLALRIRQRLSLPGTPEWLAHMLDLAEAEHAVVWSGTAQPHHRLVHQGLSRYFDINFLDMLASCESGWDHSTRCNDRWLDYLPVDLNSILHVCECDMAGFARTLGDEERALRWDARAKQRGETIRQLMWDEQSGFFLDYDYVHEMRNPTPSLAGFYPLWAGVASAEQAERVIDTWLSRFEQPGGLVTALDAQQGRQWAWPNGWAPLQWIVVQGLERYGMVGEAQRLRERWCDTCAMMHARTGVLWEKYNVVAPGEEGEEGLYGHVTGFGWTNGVFVDFARALESGRSG
jgi:alpha,alpha-trehalase